MLWHVCIQSPPPQMNVTTKQKKKLIKLGKILLEKAGELAQQLRALAVDLGSVPSIYTVAHNHLPFHWLCKHIHTGKTLIHRK